MISLEYIKARVKVNESTGCWEWQRATCRGGYGVIGIPQSGTRTGRTTLKVHRVVYELTKGDIPPDHDVCHRCDNPPCCNPDHLFSGTPKDNAQDCIAKGRKAVLPHTPDAIEKMRRAANARAEITAKGYFWNSVDHRWVATWKSEDGREHRRSFESEAEAIAMAKEVRAGTYKHTPGRLGRKPRLTVNAL